MNLISRREYLKKALFTSALTLAVVVGTTILTSEIAVAQDLSDQLTTSERLVDLISVATEKGQRSEIQDYVTYYYTNVPVIDRSQDREVSYLTVVGSEDLGGNFTPRFLSTVQEKWKKNQDGNWEIDQKYRVVSLQGEIVKSVKQFHVISEDKTVIASKEFPPDKSVDDNALFAEELKAWYKLVFP